MKIKKLEVVGFKSFVDRTVVLFDHDVTGVVGPNGCGKSNVVDAIKWVMGEQSPKMLRGGSMNDVIFNGSEVRGPAQFAEVSLTFDNSAGLVPPEYRDYAEITVSRRLDRQGRSDYFINRAPVRLLDITNLFLGTGVGRRAYSIIEQGRIGYIVTSKPEDRRVMIEEAAGITKFKAHKKAAERKMDATRENLTRVDDILRELEKNLASLKRQAQKAERFREYRTEQRDLELYVGAFRYLEAFTTLKYVDAQLSREEATSEGIRLGLRVREAETESERLAVEAASREVERAQAVAYALDNEVKMLEARIRQHRDKLSGLRERDERIAAELDELAARREDVAAERDQLERAIDSVRDVEDDANEALDRENEALSHRRRAVEEAARLVSEARQKASEVQKRTVAAEARLESVLRRRDDLAARLGKRRAERETLAEELVDLEQQRLDVAARVEGLRTGRESSAERREQCETELVALRAEASEVERVVEGLRDVVAQKRSRLRSLLEIEEKLEGVGAGTRELMRRFADGSAREAAGILGLVSDRVECDEDRQAALAGVLGDRLEVVVVDGLDNGVSALDWLRRESKGRASLVLRDHPGSGFSRVAIQDAGARGYLIDTVRFDARDASFVERLIGDVLVVDSVETASRLATAHPKLTFVTEAGDVLRGDGMLAGGQADDAAAHRLAMKREARELESTLAEEGRRFDEAVVRQTEIRRLVGERQAELDAARNESHAAELELLAVEKDLRRVEGDRDRLRTRVEDSAAEIQDLAFESSELDEAESEARDAVVAAREDEVTLEDSVTSAERAHEERRESVDVQNERVTEVRLRVMQIRERATADRAAFERVVRAEREAGSRIESLVAEQLANAANQGRFLGELHVDRETLSAQVDSAMNAQDVLGSLRAVYDETKVAASQSDGELKSLRHQLDEVATRASKLALKKSELGMAITHLVDGIANRHEGIDVRKVLRDFHDRDLPDAATLQRIDELARLIDRMGPINLLAIEEFEEQNKRFEELSGQRKDLLDALAQLDRAIRQMNKESRALFKEAFEAIDARFRLVFPQLFRGGDARLGLTNPDDLLESGVEIFAQPPGKKLGSLELMSGGEKALTAVALIFAIFQYKPSPFCILDEVDAPLDEANIARFADAVRQMTDRSQFIVITHSKRTMETADVLYGVTMEQPGISKLVAVELRGTRRPAAGDRGIAAA